MDENRIITINNARQVGKGYIQVERIDNEET